jgi:hypothetical protein
LWFAADYRRTRQTAQIRISILFVIFTARVVVLFELLFMCRYGVLAQLTLQSCVCAQYNVGVVTGLGPVRGITSFTAVEIRRAFIAKPSS